MRKIYLLFILPLVLLSVAAAPGGCAGFSIVPPGPGGAAATATPTNTPTNSPTPAVTIIPVIASPTPTLPATDTPTPTQTALPTQTLTPLPTDTPTPTPTQTAASVGTPSRRATAAPTRTATSAATTSAPLTPSAGMTVSLTVKVSSLKVFEKPDSASTAVGFLKQGNTYAPTGRAGKWLHVTADNGKASWVFNGNYVNVVGDVTTLPEIAGVSPTGPDMPGDVNQVGGILKIAQNLFEFVFGK